MEQRNEPDVVATERASLDQFLDYHRATLLGKTAGLGTEALATRLPSSELTLGGLLKHLAQVESGWIQFQFLGLPDQDPWPSVPGADSDWVFQTAAQDAAEELRERYRAGCERNRVSLAGIDLDALSVRRDSNGRQWSLRWILMHLIEETARHNGHADLLREAIDGVVGE